MQRITSRQNPVVALYRNAARGETRDALLLDGEHLVGEALAANLHFRHALVAADALARAEVAHLVNELERRTVPVAAAAAPVMDAASPVRSSSPIVALADRPSRSRSPFSGHAPLVAIICDMQDPGNVGAIVRVAEGAGATGVLVAGQSADPFGWKALRGSMGSALRLPLSSFHTVQEAVADVRRHGLKVVATTPRDGVPLFEAPLSGPIALLIGGEGPGLAPGTINDADMAVSIPMDANVESLNAAVAAAVLLYEARRQRTASQVTGAPPGARRHSHGLAVS